MSSRSPSHRVSPSTRRILDVMRIGPEPVIESPEIDAQRRVEVLGERLLAAFANDDREGVVAAARSILNIAHAMTGFLREWQLPPAFVHVDSPEEEAIPTVPAAMFLCCRVLDVQRFDGPSGRYGARLYFIAFGALVGALDAGLSLTGGNGGDRCIENPEM